MKKKSRGNKGQFSIIAALLVSVILVAAVIMTYSMIRHGPLQESPKVLTSIGEMNLSIKRILDFTVGYYGSILQVTGNSTYAKALAASYLLSGLVNIARSHPEWNPSFDVVFQQTSTLWFMPESSSMGNISVTYSLSGLGVQGVKYETSSFLKVTILEPINADEARVIVVREDNEPELRLETENFFFYNYSYSDSTWKLVNPESDPVAFSNGTYILEIPSGVDQGAYSIQVVDARGIKATAFFSEGSLASGVPQYTYTFNWNATGKESIYSSLSKDTIVVEALQNGTLRWLGQNLQLSTQGKPIPPLPVKALHINQTVSGVNREVPFQVEDWGSSYRVPLGLTSNASVFKNRNMLVFLINHGVQNVTLWWDGRDTATQTSFAWENRYFQDDDPDKGILTNGELILNFKGRKEYRYVDSFDNTYADWAETGGSPYLNNDLLNYIAGVPGTEWISYNPSGYNLLGSTSDVSGSLSDLQSDNGVYMAFGSYNSTASLAFIAYRSNTGASLLSSPKNREWDGDSWGSENEMTTAGSTVTFVRVAYCPIFSRYQEKIVVTLSNDGYLDAYVWNGSSWLVTNNIGYVGTTVDVYRSYDIVYERSSGKAMLVYAISFPDDRS